MTLLTTTKPRGSGPSFARVRRLLARPRHRATPPPAPPARPAMRRVWREVARGEWRRIHVDDHEAGD